MDGGAMGRRHRTTLEVVPFADRPQAIVSLVGVENTGTEPIDVKELHLAPFPRFSAEPLYDWGRQVKRLWGEPRRFGWISADGARRIDVESFSFSLEHRARIWKGKGGDLHPDVIFRPPRRFTLEPGATWRAPEGVFYMNVSVAESLVR